MVALNLVSHRVTERNTEDMSKRLDPLKAVIRKAFGDRLSDRLFFLARQGYTYRHSRPLSLSQKIVWYKQHGSLEQYANLADKHGVRDFVGRIIGKEYLPEEYALYRPGDRVRLADLPARFVFKATHGSHMTKIVSNRDTASEAELQALLDSWCSANLYRLTGEKQYRDIPPGVIAEELVEESDANLKEYKFFCFGGEPKYLHYQCDRNTVLAVTFVDLNWTNLPMKYAAYPNKNPLPPKPPTFDKMKEIARILSKGLPFVRVDMYSVGNRIIFSELTFCPGNGHERIVPRSADFELGRLWPPPAGESLE